MFTVEKSLSLQLRKCCKEKCFPYLRRASSPLWEEWQCAVHWVLSKALELQVIVPITDDSLWLDPFSNNISKNFYNQAGIYLPFLYKTCGNLFGWSVCTVKRTTSGHLCVPHLDLLGCWLVFYWLQTLGVSMNFFLHSKDPGPCWSFSSLAPVPKWTKPKCTVMCIMAILGKKPFQECSCNIPILDFFFCSKCPFNFTSLLL